MPTLQAAPSTLQNHITAEPDLVDRIFDYIFSDPALAAAVRQNAQPDLVAIVKLKTAVRAEFKGEECYIAGRPATARQEQVAQVLALFNGRNASEVARRLQISRRTVYRIIKQPGGLKKVPIFRDMSQP